MRRAAIALGLLLLAAVPARAQDLARLFPEEADVFTPGAGLARLPLPAEVLASCAPDLGDLRLFDRAGREVPFLVDAGVPPGSERAEERVVEARVLDLAREEVPRDGRAPLVRETYRIAFPKEAPASDAWTLVVSSDRPRYVRTAEVIGTAGDGAIVPLVPRASLVRLGQRSVDRTEIALPRFSGSEVTLAIEGEGGFFLEPTLRFASRREIADAGVLDVALPVLDRRQERGRTVLEVARPPGLVPARLRIASSTPAFDRQVAVWDVTPGSSALVRLGEGRVVRAPGAAAATSAAAAPGVAAARDLDERELDVAVARGDRLRIAIDDGDSPPLADLAVSAVVRPPALVFALPPAAEPSEAAGVLRFGGNRAWRPRYDLAGLFRDAFARDGRVLDDPAALPLARLGEVRANPRFDAAPALATVMRPGASVDPNQWRWQRPIELPGSPEGLVSLRLSPEDLAHALPDRADLRVVDGEGRQWPYAAAPALRRDAIRLGVGERQSKNGTSRWPIALPAAPLPLDRLLITPAPPVLHRNYRLVTRDEAGEERVLARGALAQDLRRPLPIAIGFGPERVDGLELVVEDGDDAPLELARVDAEIALPELLVAAPAGRYVLLAGNPDATAPQYEIGRACDVLAGLRSVPGIAGASTENPSWDGTPGGTARTRDRLQRGAIWVALIVAVAVLAALTLRVVRSDTPRAGS